MKNINKYIIVILLPFLGFLNGCENQLDLKNLTAYSPEDIWNDPNTAQAYINALYNDVLGPGWQNVNGWSDEDGKYVLIDAVNTLNGVQSSWDYASLRKLNIALEEVEASTLDDEDKGNIKGQAYFLRAWLYFDMVFQHGGVPIIDHPQSVDEDLYVSRNSTAECFDFIVEDLDRAIASTMIDRSQDYNYGMISRAAAIAFKGRVLNAKASPMYNPSNYWDNAYWNEAYTANKQAYTDLLAMGFRLLDSYGDLYDDKNGQSAINDEYILTKILKYPNSMQGWRVNQIRPLSTAGGDTGYDRPPWEFIQLFTMVDGTKIGESPTYPYTIDTYFQNRDPRFYENIYYNGCVAEIGPIPGRRQYFTEDLHNVMNYNETQDYVFDPLGGGNNWAAATGFCPKKGIQEGVSKILAETQDIDFAFMRLAEVMLNYAEAANETGHQDEAIEMLKLIRERAGIEEGDGNYGIDVSSRVSVREVIQNEFAVELYQEGRRFKDLRRWRRASEGDGLPKHGLYARLKPSLWVDPATRDELVPGKTVKELPNTLLPEDFTYEVIEHSVGTGIFTTSIPDNYQFFPIPESTLGLNDNLEQNEGWGGTFDPTLE